MNSSDGLPSTGCSGECSINQIETDGAALTVNEEVAYTLDELGRCFIIILCIQVQYYQRSLLYKSLLSWAVLNGIFGDKKTDFTVINMCGTVDIFKSF
jgi:hypothetical protein